MKKVTLIKVVKTEYKTVVEVPDDMTEEQITESFENGELGSLSWDSEGGYGDVSWKEIDGSTDSELISIEEEK